MDISQRLDQIIGNLRSFAQIGILSDWHERGADPNSQPIPLNEKGMLMLELGDRICCQQTWQVPKSVNGLSIQGATLRLSLLWWASLAEIFIDGNRIHTGDLFDQKCRLLLAQNIEPERTFTFTLNLIAPKHDRGALQKSEILFEYPHLPCDPGKLATELGIIQAYLPQLLDRNFNLDASASQLERLLAKANSQGIDSEWLSELAEIRRSLLPIGEFLKHRKVYLLGNAHIDVAWLWAIAETKDVMQRTFSSALQLQKDYPELIFNQSTALSYLWMEEEYPELFAQIQTSVRAGKWEPIGSMWVEPDCNLPNGESLIRQILYGKQYFREKFGRDSRIAWLPDTFGFNWQLPQILSKSGFVAFITQKLTWNDTNKFPHQIFWWQGLDGSKIFTYFSNEIGLGIEPVAIAKFLSQQEQKHSIPECLWLYGVGDRGGGPTADMLDLGREWSKSDLFFTLESSTAEDFILKLKQEMDESSIPCWQDELYLEFHRGTYTTKADQKRKHRRAEILIANTEKIRAIAAIAQQAAYPQPALNKAWQGLMLNQFHDILPGTSIPEVFHDADLVWDEVARLCQSIIAQVLGDPHEKMYPNICRGSAPVPAPNLGINTEDLPLQDSSLPLSIAIWNFLNWSRTEVIEIAALSPSPSPLGKGGQNPSDPATLNYEDDDRAKNLQFGLASVANLANPSPELLPIQKTEKGILIIAKDIPSFGFANYQILPAESDRFVAPIPPVSITSSELNPEIYLENQYLKVTINSQTGDIDQIFDKRYNNSLLGKSCELQFFSDRGQYWDAWNIDPAYESKQLPNAQLESLIIQEQGPIRVSLSIVKRFGRSRFQQDIYLDAYSAYVTVKNIVDWQEDRVLVKMAFPLSFSAPFATYEIPMGAIARSTMAETPEARAKFEVPAQFWADLSSDGIGLSVLNDCKYGYDAKPDRLRLTLLRSPNWPALHADRGVSEFTYRLLPHQGSWQHAQIVREGYNLNNPLEIFPSRPTGQDDDRDCWSFLSISSKAIVLSAFKLAEDTSGWIVRLYEAHGERVTTEVAFSSEIKTVVECDLMERDFGETIARSLHQFSCEFQPYEIKTFRVQFGSKSALGD
ncbi:alpha-mannosidase [Pseudanabaena sp. PCC 6802]|uniref:alpha-mannosidase n=1 Tax=Pseudanabaena sp. PCC 6802 TaxID=118173 RepID=UPI00034C59F4|nr:glycoside hydrolase family 38 C-terminal domain-containing protein [Pseudanabaena sp. PCC 6802]